VLLTILGFGSPMMEAAISSATLGLDCSGGGGGGGGATKEGSCYPKSLSS
jgi:hypothetical protein